jgi:hypothetical protein
MVQNKQPLWQWCLYLLGSHSQVLDNYSPCYDYKEPGSQGPTGGTPSDPDLEQH